MPCLTVYSSEYDIRHIYRETRMSHAALTARYRPQTFAEVAGQETIKTILSRASLEGKVAPAYLFSGTRGVGKTTLARIFAKALNCRNAPTAEPCNQCDQCRAITTGNAVDVVEIDGASNRGIDDVRRLKEVVGYAAMEGGYKIFIIDEAHMLSREAFNALLKTLEEPPARVTFIMATTEPHKFPATIISRCQHYVFKRLPESGLVEHLSKVLSREGVEFEENALRLIARRGAGSVRDSMSLLGQVLALGQAELTEESVRNVLGLAGQESFLKMLEAFKSGDSVGLSLLLRDMLDQGLDMGFFLRELAALWRNLFMLRQSGEAALPVVELPEKEARACLESAGDFSLQHIHACWQMTLDGQRRVLASLEPALALELLLLNIAMLPRLLPLEGLAGQAAKTPSSVAGPSGGSPGPGAAGPVGNAPSSGTAPGVGRNMQSPRDTPVSGKEQTGPMGQATGNRPQAASPVPAEDDDKEPEPRQADGPATAALGLNGHTPPRPLTRPAPVASEGFGAAPGGFGATHDGDEINEQDIQDALSQTPFSEEEFRDRQEPPSPGQDAAIGNADHRPHAPNEQASLPDWSALLALCQEKQRSPRFAQLLRRAEARYVGKKVLLVAQDSFSAESLRAEEIRGLLDGLFSELCGFVPEIEVRDPEVKRKSREDLKQEILNHPLVREVENLLGARAIDYGQIR